MEEKYMVNEEQNQDAGLLQAFLSSRWIPVGFGFRPTDVELVSYYLKLKNDGLLRPNECYMIPEFDVYSCDPQKLASDKSLFQSGDPVWHFFSPKNRKYPRSRRHNRATGNGSWKVTGEVREITVSPGSPAIGKKKTLVFYEGRAPASTRTVWIIHEYTTTDEKDGYVLCRLLKKPEEVLKKKRKLKGVTSCSSLEVEGCRSKSTFSPTTSIVSGKTWHGATAIVEILPSMKLSGIDLQGCSSEQPIGINMRFEDYTKNGAEFQLRENHWYNNTASSSSNHVAGEAGREVGYLTDGFGQFLNPECGRLGPEVCESSDVHIPLCSSFDDAHAQQLPIEMLHDFSIEQNPPNDWVHLGDFISSPMDFPCFEQNDQHLPIDHHDRHDDLYAVLIEDFHIITASDLVDENNAESTIAQECVGSSGEAKRLPISSTICHIWVIILFE